MPTPKQQVGKAEARAVDRLALRMVRPQLQERVGLAIMANLPQAAIAALCGAAKFEARAPLLRPRQEARRFARAPCKLALFVQPEQPAVVADGARPPAGRQCAAVH